MKPFLKFLLILSAIVFSSCLLAPVFYQLLPFKFERIFNRLIMIFSLVAVFIFVRFRTELLKDYGLLWKKDSLSLFWRAFLSAWGILVILSLTKVALGISGWQSHDLSIAEISARIGKDILAALVIGVLEEFFFRGFIFKTFLNRWNWPLAASVLTTSVFYSILHFVSVKKPPIGADPNFFDALKLVAAPFASFTQWQSIWPGAVGLLIFGLILNHLVIRTGSLYPAIGLHAGAVFFIKSDALLVDSIKAPSLLFGSGKAYDGVMGWGFLLMLEILLFVLIRKPRDIKQ